MDLYREMGMNEIVDEIERSIMAGEAVDFDDLRRRLPTQNELELTKQLLWELNSQGVQSGDHKKPKD